MPVEATPLFRPDTLRSHLRDFELPAHSAEGQEVLRRWAEFLSTPQGQAKKETELLPDFFSEVFQGILGYTSPVAQSNRYTISRETLVEVGGKFADAVLGEFTPNEQRFVVAVEGKGPTDPLERPYAGRKMSAVDQGYRYAINLPCDWIIVTNLRQIRLYHKGSTQRQYERFDVADLAADERELKRFVFLLGAERVVPVTGRCHLYALLEASEKAGEEVTQAFYREYAQIRRELLAALVKDNPDVDPERVLTATQKLLDRVLFIAFCEDRGLLPEHTLARAYEATNPFNPQPIWENFQGLFRAIDKGNETLKVPAYNGGLFREDPVLDQLRVRDEVTRHFKRLGDYDYRALADVGAEADAGAGHVVDVEILGHIFEQSITDLEALEAELQEEGPQGVSKRKVTGAFYTPGFVTRYIVGEALRPVLQERFERLRAEHIASASGTAPRVLEDPSSYVLDDLNVPQRQALLSFWEGWPEALKTVRVVDPACGSGAFLIEAFDQLYAEYQKAVDHLEELRGQRSFFDPDRNILQHNLFGADLNEEAIQIARLSIWIKTAQRGKVLTDLDHNIRAGNSIIADPAVDPRAFDWRDAFPGVFEQGGFDVVIGNPPYVRAELLTAIKPYLAEHYETYHGAADLYVYFYELGLKLLRPGGYLSYIVTNKWFKAAYGEPLRRFYSEHAILERVIDFGHAPIFPDADVFPTIVVLQKPSTEGTKREDRTTQVCLFPREDLGTFEIPQYVDEHGYEVTATRFGAESWSLERPGVEALMKKIRRGGPPLREFVGASPLYGIKTGFNEAFLIDTATKEQLVQDDPRSADVIRPYLRGQDVQRWSPGWAGLWMVVIKSSENHAWAWSGAPEHEAEAVFASTYPAVYLHMKGHEARLRKRSDQGQYWWELRSCAYYSVFEEPKIIWKDLAFHSTFCFDEAGYFTNDLCFILPTSDLWVVAALNSPLMWAYMWRTVIHGKDEVLRLKSMYTEEFPIAVPSPEMREVVEPKARDLISIAKNRQIISNRLLDWLRVEFGVEKAGNKLSAPEELNRESFIAEVKKRKAGGSALTSAGLKRLRDEFDQTIQPLVEEVPIAEQIEREIADAVNRAYGLTPEEVELLWVTAPPRMP